MILPSEITAIGHTIKPHGINGEIAAAIDADIDLDQARCLIMDIDGINVPFFINSWRSRGSEAVLLTIDGVNDETEAQRLCGKTLYALTDDVNDEHDGDDGLYADDLQGFTVTTPEGDTIGTVTAVDTSTPNTLLIVLTPDDRTVYIPVADEFITSLDPEARTIEMNLPQGLLDI